MRKDKLKELDEKEQKQVTGGTEPNVLPGETAGVGEVAYNKGHCGIYIGGGSMVHPPTAGEVKSEGQE